MVKEGEVCDLTEDSQRASERERERERVEEVLRSTLVDFVFACGILSSWW